MKVQFFGLRPPDLMAIPEQARPTLMGDTRGVVARDEEGEIQAICTLDSWSPNSCQMHIWINNPLVLRHGFQEEVFGFIFGEDSGRNKVICVMPSNNEKVVRFNKHMGFTELLRIKDGFDDGIDFIVTELNKQDCRWINHG